MQELKQMPIWVIWRYEMVNGSRRKVLYSVKTGKRSGTDFKYSKTWVNYDNSILHRKRMGADGIGFILPKGYMAIDLDHMEDTSEVLQSIYHLFESYTEISPSGAGRHIICKVDASKIPQKDRKLDPAYYMNNAHIDVEFYCGDLTNRYMTFTGNEVRNLPIKDCTDSILIFLETYMRKDLFQKKRTSVVAANGTNCSLDDIDILCIARKAKNSEKFIALYDKGDTSAYGSASEADLAECCILAFYTGGDLETIDRLHRAGALMREKWEREDYRNNTMQKAITLCNGNFYSAVRPLPPFMYVDQKQKICIRCPLLAKHFRENQYMISVRDSGRGGVQRYLYKDGCYRPYADEMLKGVIKSYITDYDETLLCMKHVHEVFQQLVTDLNFVATDRLNEDEDLINFTNGFLEVTSLKLHDHDPSVLSTIQLPCAWTGRPEPTPVFDDFMATLTDGNEDIKELILEFIGVCLSNVKGWRMKKALFMVGPGDTGKSQLKSLTELLLGKGNFVAIDLGEIEARFGTGNIYGKRLAGSSDMSFMTVEELKTFKKCTGGDSLFAEFKGQNGFEFTYNGLLWFCMNRLPRFGGDDGVWVYNRIMQIECKNVIPFEKQDKYLLDKMYAERNGIVYQAVMALKKVIQNGYAFAEPQSVTAARKAYMVENNTVISFFDECMEKRTDRKIMDGCTTGKVYEVYKAWCRDNNHGFCKTAKEFRTELSLYLNTPHSDLITRRGKGGNFYRNYTLTNEAKETYKLAYGHEYLEFL